MLAARDEQRGVLSGLLGLSRNLGFMTGASVMATLFATAVGTEAITSAPPRAIGDAFTATFVVAASLTLLALILALFGRRRPESASAPARKSGAPSRQRNSPAASEG